MSSQPVPSGLRRQAQQALHCLCLVVATAMPMPGWADGRTTASLSTLDYQLKPRPLTPNTWVIEGAVDDFSKGNGCNIINTGFIITATGVVVVNTGPSRLYGEAQRRALVPLTSLPVLEVVSLNLHPDYFFGHQAWSGARTAALPGTIAGMQAEGKAYESNLFRLCGDWMKGTESTPAQFPLAPGRRMLGGHDLEWVQLKGHTSDDLVIIDHTSNVIFAGGLVFANRAPTMPHAQLAAWRASLLDLQLRVAQMGNPWVVPSHGPVHQGSQGIEQTLDWINWLDKTLQESANQGLDIGEVMRLRIPTRFQHWAAVDAEYIRSVTYLYPSYELSAMTKR